MFIVFHQLKNFNMSLPWFISLYQVYFLRDPEIDYSLGGVAGALDIPGLNKVRYPYERQGPWTFPGGA
jgi:hypothetical protein